MKIKKGVKKEMTNWGFTGKEISKKLDNKTIRNGGLTIITMPIINVSNEVDTIEYGGYKGLVHYNVDREEQHKQDKFNKSMRKLRRNIKNKSLCQKGLTHKVTQTDIEGDIKT